MAAGSCSGLGLAVEVYDDEESTPGPCERGTHPSAPRLTKGTGLGASREESETSPCPALDQGWGRPTKGPASRHLIDTQQTR